MIFSSPARDPSSLERKIERRLGGRSRIRGKDLPSHHRRGLRDRPLRAICEGPVEGCLCSNVGFLADPLDAPGVKVVHGFGDRD